MDKWKLDISEDLVEVEVQGGDCHINQDFIGTTKNPLSGVDNTSEFEAVDAEFEPEFEPEFKQAFEPVLGITPSLPSQQENERPTRTRKPVSRLIPTFKGKSYGTTMAQISARMVGLSTKESIKFMESELTQMGTDDQDTMAMGIIMAHMSVKQATKKFGVNQTN